jgi:hypothetical protein
MPLPPPPAPSSGGGSSGSSGKKKKRGSSSPTQTKASYDPWVVFHNGHISFVNSANAPNNALKSFGLPIKRSDYLQAKSHYNDLFQAWVGHKANPRQIARILQHGVSDFSLRLWFTKRPGFVHSAVYRSYTSQANQVLGLDYKLGAGEIRQSILNGGDLKAALAGSQRARQAVTKSFMSTSGADAQYYSGAFGQGQLGGKQQQALALQASGLRQSTLGASLQGALDQAMKRYQRVFQGTLASPSLSLGGGGLSAPSLLGQQQEPDVPA